MPEHSPKPKQLNQEEVAVKAPDSIESLRAMIKEKEKEAANPESGKDVEPEILELETKLREIESSNKESVIRERIAKLEYEAAHPVPGALKMESPEQEILDLEEELHGLERKRKGITAEENPEGEDKQSKEKLEREKLQSQIENNSHPRAKKTKENLFFFIDSLERDSYNTPILEKFQLLKDELSEVLYRNDIEYAEDKEIKINEEDKVIVQPILDFRKEMDALNPLDPRALADYKDRLLEYMGSTFGVESYKPKEGDMVNSKTTQVIKVHGTNVSLLDQRIKKVLGSGYKFNDEFLKYYKESQANNEKVMKEKWNSLKGTIPDDELSKIIDKDREIFDKYVFYIGNIRPAKVETYSSTAHEEATQQPAAEEKKEGNPESDKEKKVQMGETNDMSEKSPIQSNLIPMEERAKQVAHEIESGKGNLKNVKAYEANKEAADTVVGDKAAQQPEDRLRAFETGVEGTPKENREKLKEVVGRFENDEHVKTYKEYLGNRSEELNTEAKKSGLEGAFRWMGEKYNKIPTWQKVVLGGSLAVGYGVTLPISGWLAVAYAAPLFATRLAAMAGSFIKNHEMLDRINKGDAKGRLENTSLYKWLGSGSKENRKNKAMSKAVIQSFVMTGGMLYAAHELADRHVAERIVQWMVDHIKPGGTTGASVSEHIATLHNTTQHATNGAPPAHEISDISVEASTGHGYEWMMKRMYEQLNDAGLDPEQYPEESDIRQLLDANDSTIDAVVHRIASNPDHGFFNPDGTSVLIDSNAHMTIDSSGHIQFNDNVEAPANAHFTSAPHHGAPVSHTNNMPAKGADTGSTEGVSGQKATPDEPPAEAPAAPAETKVPEAQTTPVEHPVEWTNSNGVKIDPQHAHIYRGQNGWVFSFGDNNDARSYAMQAFTKANPGTSVWTQAEIPVLDPTTNTPHSWMQEYVYRSGKLIPVNQDGPTSLNQVGEVNPEMFTKQLDVK